MISKTLLKKAENAFKNNLHQSLIDEGFICSLSASERDEIFRIYFSGFKRNKWYCDAFERFFAAKYPHSFIKMVRINQVFLQTDRIDFLLSLSLPFEFKKHQIIWKHLQEKELDLWKRIDKELDLLSGQSLSLILISVVSWIENRRFEEDTKKNINDLAAVYSFFIHAYLSKYSSNQVGSEQDMFQLLPPVTKSNPLDEILNFIEVWLNFTGILIHDYSYDLSLEFTEHNGTIYQKATPQSLYKWRVDEFRYNNNKIIYEKKSRQFLEYLEAENKLHISKGKFWYDENASYELEVKKQARMLFLSDLHLEKFRLNKKDINAFDLMTPLLIKSTNYLYRYDTNVSAKYSINKNWLKSYLLTAKELSQEKIEIRPYYFDTVASFIQQNKDISSPTAWNIGKELTELVSFKVKSNSFNRFGNIYDVWKRPYLNIKGHLFCPIAFLSNNDWFYAFAQAGLDNLSKRESIKIRKNSATNMEQELGKCFIECGFEVKVFDDKTASNVRGDVDVIVTDGESTLFIQLKRTKFKLNQKATYFESILVDKKAAQQLNDAEDFLSENSKIYNLNQRPDKWLVTTSFEVIGDIIDGCRKVNYFDIIHALRSNKIKSISQLKSVIEKDGILKQAQNIFHNTSPFHWLNGLLSDAGLPFEIPPTEQYYRPIILDIDNIIEHNRSYEKALSCDEQGQKQNSVKLFLECHASNPLDVEICGALGNIYADLKDYKNSFLFFEKVLEIIPLDPFIARNYSSALIESGQHFKGLSLLVKLIKTYPLIQDFQNLFSFMFTRSLPKLSKEQIISLTS